MHTTIRTLGRDGSVVMITAVFMAIASLALVSIFVASNTYSRINHSSYERERAFLLADAGLRAAALQFEQGGNGVIDIATSRQFFANTNVFRAANWGFSTTVSNLSATLKRVSSFGEYGGGRVTATANIHQTQKTRNIHPLYSHAIYAGNSSRSTNYVLRIGGVGTAADFVIGDVYSGNNIQITGDARLRLPETYTDLNGNGFYDEGEGRVDSGTTQSAMGPMDPDDFAAYLASLNNDLLYPNGIYDNGEAFVDTIGNGVYDSGEEFTDLDGDGQYGFGEPFNDGDEDGEFDSGESFVDRGNGQYDSGEEFVDANNNGIWDAAQPGYYKKTWNGRRWVNTWVPPVPAEDYADEGNGQYDVGEEFEDRNGIYDPGEDYADDRNGRFDYGTTATGTITGAPTPGLGQQAATGSNEALDPPNLRVMYYSRPKTASAPADASADWGHDVNVAAAPFNSNGRITNTNNPSHIFVKNPTDRSYTKITGKNDYFLEDPSDASYGNSHQFLNVNSSGNEKVYYVDGNLYLHNPSTYDFMFRQPGVRITIVANGNITLSDEFWYNGGTENPQDSLALIAMKDPAQPNSGNIYLGDAQFGTGGDIHAMLYAENNFVDNNLDTTGQPYLSVFGNMTAGNEVNIKRDGPRRTRLDVTLDERIVQQRMLPPGLPAGIAGQRQIGVPGAWEVVRGSWYSHSPLF